jgi:hypothetical protein
MIEEMVKFQKVGRRAAKRAARASSGLSSQPGGQFVIYMLAVTDGHEADDARLAVNGVDDSKSTDAILPQAV